MDQVPDKIRCDACPVLCYIRDGLRGACDRYANQGGELIRVDAHVLLQKTVEQGGKLVHFLDQGADWDGRLVGQDETFVTAIGADSTKELTE